MTSYATTNESATVAAAGAPATTNVTNTSTEAGVNVDDHNVTTPLSSTSTSTSSSFASPRVQLPAPRITHTKLEGTPLQENYDSSFSDEREKADTTPENIKKIDDVIEHERRSAPLHYHNNSASAADSSALQHLIVDLTAAVDESNAKLCLAKDMLRKSGERIESSGVTPTSSSSSVSLSTQTNSSNNKIKKSNNNKSDNSEIKSDMSEAHNDDSSASNNTTTTTTATTTANKQSLAFTIDNFNDNNCDPATAAAKYKNMMERFQSRHRRGASLSKLENENSVNKDTIGKDAMTSSTTSLRNARNSYRTVADKSATASFDAECDGNSATAAANIKVKLRARDRSTSRVRDAAQRHSWSPRSSTHELSHTQSTQPALTQRAPQAPQRKSVAKKKPPPIQLPKGAANLMANRTHFTPRSTAMQMALQKVDYLGCEPPLADCIHTTVDGDDISDTGTYTLDGDNYTEEQKDLMNIDKSGREKRPRHRPKDLKLVNDSNIVTSVTKIPTRSSNVLEMNCYHGEEIEQEHQKQRSPPFKATEIIISGSQVADIYLEKIKQRVMRNISSTKDSSQLDMSSIGSQPTSIISQNDAVHEGDMGCFTSVTTSGVLAKQGALDPRPKLTRKSSLSTSQIDSSEYISNESKLNQPNASAYAAGGFTDHQKSEYRLNVFTNQKEKFTATRSVIESPPETLLSSKHSDTTALKTAQTKSDWIQEWARNARARSLASDTNTNTKTRHSKQAETDLMTRSYTCSSDRGEDMLIGDSNCTKQYLAKLLNKTLAERYRLNNGECDYSSDPSLPTTSSHKSSHDGVCKPPKSPSKIPSPMHSLGRARSACRMRAPLQSEQELDEEEDVHLQTTAAAINNLQQSLSRKNSLKSPTNSASPRANMARTRAPLYSPEDCSPKHSLESPTASGSYHQRSPMHRRNVTNDSYARSAQSQLPNQLMTSSFNEQQLKLLINGDYLVRQMRMRKNSFDGNIEKSPNRRIDKYAVTGVASHTHAPQTPYEHEREEQSLSPLRRSNSFSTKITQTNQRAARPQYQNIYTPPAARHNYGGITAQQTKQAALAIQKSASSNNFGQVYSDYDDNLEYYINDQDDITGGEYYSSDEDDDPLEEFDNSYYQDGDVTIRNRCPEDNARSTPFTTTRYNKALMMRIESSKQKVTGNVSSAPTSALKQNSTGAGVVACPNTPELPRRNIKSAPRAGGGNTAARQSMPRDVSLNRLATQVPNSLASAKKQLLRSAALATKVYAPSSASASHQRVQPKYLDISKYKKAQGNNFLRKNDAKSTLKTSADAIKRSPSTSSVAFNRADPTRVSNRSVKSINPGMTSSASAVGIVGGAAARASSAARRDASVSKQKEAEMAMWKRRSTYDPMKAAAEDRRKKEEAKRLALAKLNGEVPCERPSRSTYRRGQL